MVRITNLHEEEIPEEVPEEVNNKEWTTQEIEEITNKHTKEMNPFSVAGDEAKTEKINARITTTMGNTLRAYTELNNISISQFLEELITEKFEGKKVNRDCYPIEETIVCIPETVELIQEYSMHKINLIVDKSKIYNSINPYDKQYIILNEKRPLAHLLYINGSNNYLDKLDPESRFYYNPSSELTGEDPFKEFENDLKPIERLKRHKGLIIHHLSEIKEYDKNTQLFQKKELKKPLFLYLLVHEYENRINKVQIINRDKALYLAIQCDNTELQSIIRNSEDITKYKPIQDELETIYSQMKTIQDQKEIISMLEKENRKLNEYKKSKETIEEEKEELPEEAEVLAYLKENIEYMTKKEDELTNITLLLTKYYQEVSREKDHFQTMLRGIEEKKKTE